MILFARSTDAHAHIHILYE